ncbi:hypothetical protein HLB23_14705 [Nocardia uniformis]|uniref:Uncharacterized protein n=1 Tax=Nocardia uniformis TaxID=53432 RepID=A0A849CDE2_9NOCA|nr:hypothetical protein [Nocardia uniformis]NNH71101.1 hypothetical protein [Nocardia uniformis]
MAQTAVRALVTPTHDPALLRGVWLIWELARAVAGRGITSRPGAVAPRPKIGARCGSWREVGDEL